MLAVLKSRLPGYAKVLHLNLELVLTEAGAPGLTRKQIVVMASASAVASRCKPLTAAINQLATRHASAEALNGAGVAAAITGMNSIVLPFHRSPGRRRVRYVACQPAHQRDGQPGLRHDRF